jgi:HAD superfamily phosphoserine phosphatase-like hydrolase
MTKKRLAIFDIDGTIFRKNLHFELLTELVFSGVFARTSKKKITKMYGDWVNKRISYEQHRDAMVRLYQENLVGCKEADIKKVAQKVAKINSERIYIFSKNLIQELREKYHLLVISGSPVEAVSVYAEILNFDDFFGSVYEIDEQNKYTGKEIFVPVWDKGRVVNNFIKEKGFSLEKSVGVGDTDSDAKFLELTERSIAFNPNKNLKEIAEKRNWEIIVERKDVIYKIN